MIASRNPDKVAEIEGILARLDHPFSVVRGLEWDEIEETGISLEENALLKARTVAAATGLAALADDTGLAVVALGGAPGVATARYAGPQASYADNVAKLLAALEGTEDRRAAFQAVVALVQPSGAEWLGEGRLEGRIAHAPQGGGGFGYDPVFLVDHRSLAELGDDEKNRISHRALALIALVARIPRN